jgi:hypothetical protein
LPYGYGIWGVHLSYRERGGRLKLRVAKTAWIVFGCGGAFCGSPFPASAQGATASDTTTPVVPAVWDEHLDTALTVPYPANPNVRYYRHRFLLAFDSTASGQTIREVLARYHARIVGGVPSFKPRGAFVIAVPDPGPDALKWKALYDSLAAERGVVSALGFPANSRLDVER